MQANFALAVLSTLLLMGCGGGGGESPTQPVTPELPLYLVSTQVGAGGSVSPSSVQVRQGMTSSLNVTAAVGFTVDSVSGCGGSFSNGTFTTGVINAACTVTASFKK